MRHRRFRLRPPGIPLTPEIRWVFIRAFGQKEWQTEEPIDSRGACRMALLLDLGPRIASRTESADLVRELGPEGAENIYTLQRSAAVQALRLIELSRLVASTAAELGVPVIFLKGMAQFLAGETEIGSRDVGDVDIIAPESNSQRLWKGLVEVGLLPQAVESRHEYPLLIHPRFGIVELHRFIPGLRLGGGNKPVCADNLMEKELLCPAGSLPHALIPNRKTRIAHALVHALHQHVWSPRAYPFFRVFGDLQDLGVACGEGWEEALSPLIGWRLSRREISAVLDLLEQFSGNDLSDVAASDPGALLRHGIASVLVPRYRAKLRYRLFVDTLLRRRWYKFGQAAKLFIQRFQRRPRQAATQPAPFVLDSITPAAAKAGPSDSMAPTFQEHGKSPLLS